MVFDEDDENPYDFFMVVDEDDKNSWKGNKRMKKEQKKTKDCSEQRRPDFCG